MDNIVDTGTKYWYITDHLGSTRGLNDQSGALVWWADYEAFGNVKAQGGTKTEEVPRFTGKAWDGSVGLYYFNARWYDPGLGRFVEEDALRDPNNPNLYAYCLSNPLSYTDPTGYLADPGGGGGGGAAGGGTPEVPTPSTPETPASAGQLPGIPDSPGAALGQDVSNLGSAEIENRLRDTYGDAAVDIVLATIGDKDLSEFMKENGLKSISDLTQYMRNLYSDVNARRTLIAELGFGKFESTINGDSADGLETMAYTADASWFLAGGSDKWQFAKDFAYAFNLDINQFIPGGEGQPNWNIRTLIHDKYGTRFGPGFLPSTGFRECYLDGNRSQSLDERRDDQAHHFSGCLCAVAFLNRFGILGKWVNRWHEIDTMYSNTGDMNLGDAAYDAYFSPEFWQSPTNWIRDILGI